MGRPKKYMRVTISLGQPDDPARIFVERFIEKYGKRKLSPYLRNLIASQDTESKKKMLKKREGDILQQITELGKVLRSVQDEIEEEEK